MKAHLKSISVSDFRSLRGTVTVPLDAPVVLIHGANGVGKTSVLSALEFVLTGEVLALRRADPNYRAHLKNRDADHAAISLSMSRNGEGQTEVHDLLLKDDKVVGRPVLTATSSRFFSERCYLAQATLSRLLEIYQHAAQGEDNPLTRFVKDLLGLDQLDALIIGLHAALDIRNTRHLVPEYGQIERSIAALTDRINEANRKLSELLEQNRTLRASIPPTLAIAFPAFQSDPENRPVDELEKFLADERHESELVVVTGHRREVASLKRRWDEFSGTQLQSEIAIAEGDAQTAEAAVNKWWNETGNILESIIDQLRALFPDLPSIRLTDPETAQRTALSRVETELSRCNRALADDDAVAARLEVIEQSIGKSRARSTVIESQFGQITSETAALSKALAAIIPHIHNEICPVCGRDYREVSKSPLIERLSSQVAGLTEQASRLQSLGQAGAQAMTELTTLERERSVAVSRRLTPDARGELKKRVADLSEARRRLAAISASVIDGSALIRRSVLIQGSLALTRARTFLEHDLRAGAEALCKAMGQPLPGSTESIGNVIQRLERHVASWEKLLNDRQRSRHELQSRLSSVRMQEADMRRLRVALDLDQRSQSEQEQRLKVAETRRHAARLVSRTALESRASIVSRIFNSALNKLWRDLFVRLAPSEPFVPAFRVPESLNEPVTARLVTAYKNGGSGGAPGAMLSSGNLNTAALTLFLALHLSVKPELDWLILDDPVQSMDELHIAQFAALLRTLSKEHGRRVIMAIHEKPLFDYLSLELSPAFDGDRLITVEITKTQSGESFVEPSFRTWQPDPAAAA
jgi:exonuclease SbcC